MKNSINYIINFLAFITFLLVAITGIILFFTHSWIFTRVTLKLIHDYSGLVFTGLVLIHLLLHWKWIYTMTKNYLKKLI